MDKNSLIGFLLIGVILVGFSMFQSRKASEQAAIQAQIDSAARVEALALEAEAAAQAAQTEVATPVAPVAEQIYADSLVNAALKAEASFVTLENDKLKIEFSTRGAQPYSVTVKDFQTYEKEDLQIFRPGEGRFNIGVYAGNFINTEDFNFQVAECTDTTVVMRLPFSDGGYIEQKYCLAPGAYNVENTLSFVGMTSIPRNASSIDVDFSMMIPRMEKGYKNESQYSKLDYYFNGEKKPEEMGRGRSASKHITTKLSWFAFQQQFFSAILRCPSEFSSGDLAIEFQPEGNEGGNLMYCSADMHVGFAPGQKVEIPFQFYFGPNHLPTLASFDQKYDKIIPLGGWLVGWFTRYVIIPLFNWLHKYIANFGIIILIMTLLIKTVVLPLTYKSYASSAKMQALKPLIEKINEKYPKQEDAMKKNQATMDLYKRAGASPMGGCLPTLLTFPILWAMFRFFPASIELRQQSFLWAEDLSAYDSIVDFGFRIPLLGDHLSLFALLMAVVMWLYSKMTTKGQASNDPNTKSMQFMTVWMMPIMMFFICDSLSSGLSYYYLLSQLISMAQIFLIRKSIKSEEILEKVRKSEGKPLPKSKWQQRLEEAQKMQEQQLKAQQKNRR